eukprot:SAG25_NODE_107_length_15283_cov_3.516728_17_plen_205_part_00
MRELAGEHSLLTRAGEPFAPTDTGPNLPERSPVLQNSILHSAPHDAAAHLAALAALPFTSNVELIAWQAARLTSPGGMYTLLEMDSPYPDSGVLLVSDSSSQNIVVSDSSRTFVTCGTAIIPQVSVTMNMPSNEARPPARPSIRSSIGMQVPPYPSYGTYLLEKNAAFHSRACCVEHGRHVGGLNGSPFDASALRHLHSRHPSY